MNRLVKNSQFTHGQNEISLTLLQLAAGCALLVFGLRVLAPVPVQTPEWPAPAVAAAPLSVDRELPDCEGNSAAVKGWRVQTAACVTGGELAAELPPPLSI